MTLWSKIALTAVLVCLVACGGREPDSWREPRSSARGEFLVSIASELDPIRINRIHEWTVTIVGRDGRPVEGAEVRLDGGMPEHQHGLPTVPEMTADLGDGRYRISGMKFSMAGWWQLTVSVRAGDVRDVVTFDVVLE